MVRPKSQSDSRPSMNTTSVAANVGSCPRRVLAAIATATSISRPIASESTAIKVVPASSLQANCTLSQITNSADLEQWLSALKQAAEAELNQGHRISL